MGKMLRSMDYRVRVFWAVVVFWMFVGAGIVFIVEVATDDQPSETQTYNVPAPIVAKGWGGIELVSDHQASRTIRIGNYCNTPDLPLDLAHLEVVLEDARNVGETALAAKIQAQMMKLMSEPNENCVDIPFTVPAIVDEVIFESEHGAVYRAHFGNNKASVYFWGMPPAHFWPSEEA